MKKFDFKSLLPHLLIVTLFFIAGYIFFMPNFQHKNHSESDMSQFNASTTEINKIKDKEGKYPGWTNAIFSGMPTQIMVGKSTQSVIAKANYLTPFDSWTKYPFKIIFINMIGFYILLLCFGIDKWLSFAGAIAYALATYSISSIEAAHYTKVLAMGMMPAVIGGFYLLIQKKYIPGLFVMAFHLAIQTRFYHYQISYYTLISLLIFGIIFAVFAIKQHQVKHLIYVFLLSVVGIGAGFVSDIGQLRSTLEYSKTSMRGGSELAGTESTEEAGNSNVTTKGLSVDYAFSWSYGIGETFTTIIPSFSGGSTAETPGKSSALYKHLIANNVPVTDALRIAKQPLPTYHGAMPMTSGPVYFGAILMFLFVLGIILIKDWIKWPIIGLVAVSLILSWGKNLGFINNLLFEYLPYYNKFRTPMMALSIAQFAMPLLGLMGLNKLLTDARPLPQRMKDLKLAVYISGGIIFAFGVVFSFFYDYGGLNDERIGNQVIVDALIAERGSMLRMDAFRSLVLIGLTFGAIWALFNQKIKKQAFYAVFAGLMIFDLGGVAKRYLPWDEFKFKDKDIQSDIQPSMADQQILQDKDLHYRVFDLARDPFNDNTSSKFHRLIGGYHPAKLSRYQDLISNQIAKQNQQVLDMLNTKYLIGKPENSEQEISQLRPTALGNAWFVSNLKWVKSPKEEMDALTTLNTRNDAVADESFKSKLGSFAVTPPDSLDKVVLTSYHPDLMQYKSESKSGGLAVFSEIYYQPGWQAFLDGKPVEHIRVNYVLRALPIPAGNHEIKFVFEDKSEKTDHTIELLSSLFIILLLPASLFLYFRRKDEATA
jgi:hypothetical protein